MAATGGEPGRSGAVAGDGMGARRTVDGITELGSEVFAIDTRMGGFEGITAGYLIRGARPCLIETGTALSAPRVVAALSSLGIAPDDLAHVVVTHIHLDHAGGVGDIAAAFPRARVVVHERGARHLVDPDRLLASARRVFGATMDELFGDLRPTDAERVTALGESDRIDLGDGRYLDSFHAPGHASHHVGLVDSATGDLYTGDAAGVYIPETADVRPSTPPPDFDLDLALASMARMRDIRPTRLLFSHFGPVADVDTVLEHSEAELHRWVEFVREARAKDLDLDHAVAMVWEKTRLQYDDAGELSEQERASLARKFETLSSTAANVAGISRWLDTVEGPGSTSGDAAGVAR